MIVPSVVPEPGTLSLATLAGQDGCLAACVAIDLLSYMQQRR